MKEQNSRDIKIKLFNQLGVSNENRINLWLAENDVVIVDIQYQVVHQDNGSVYSVLVVYKDKK